MNTHSTRVLEFGEIISMLQARTACPLGDETARQLEPTADFLTITEGQKETSEARTVIEEEGGFPLGGIHDIRPQVNKAAMDGMLDPSELLSVSDTLASGRRLRAFVMKRAETSPKLGSVAANIGQFPRIEQAIKDSIADNGEIRDSASPELARIRSKLKTTHSRMMDKLHSIIQSAEYSEMIQEHIITQRGDRYCIPVKAEHRPHLPGIVHDSSASGATVFIEPTAVVDMGNDLKELTLKEQQEIEKILQRLSGMIKAASSEIQVTLDALGRLDFASAKARLSCDMDAVEPTLNRDGKVNIRKARHPLLKGEVVPIDIELGRRFSTLLITGPNTGGKTVTLKTLGLLTLMAQSGLHVPGQPDSELAVFDEVFADIGDEQSIQQSLSTFSSHMTNIVNVINRLGKNSLVLLDEIGAGTDPAEGAALAKAILEHLVEHGARVVATTHYGELKEFAFVREGVENASVEFDIQTLRPTYRLMIGVPGSSNAFSIAARLGLPEQIIESAKEMVQGGESSEEIIREIEKTHRTAMEREQLAERTSRDVEILRSRYEQRLDELAALKRDIRQQLTDEIEARVRERVDELDEIIQELKTQPEPEKKVPQSRERFKKRVKEIHQEIEETLPPDYEDTDEPFVLRAGDRVLVTTFNVEGDLLNDPGDGDAIVLAGSMKVNVPFDVLRPARRPKPKKVNEPTGAVQITTNRAANVSPELKLIAQRVEQALENLDKYMDDVILAGLPTVRIIHGMGTGALKKAVWEYLSNHHAVESYRLGEKNEGGAGATVVKFKDR